MPERIQRKRTRGWVLPPNTVYVGRPSRWGNPYVVTKFSGTHAEAVELFGMQIRHGSGIWESMRQDLSILRGKNLACWCALSQPCHADVLLELANA